MNHERAVEEILRGNPWLPCPQCDDGSQSRWFGERGAHVNCPVCAGGAYIPRKEHKEACNVLLRDMPPCPEYRMGKLSLHALRMKEKIQLKAELAGTKRGR